MKNSSLNDKSKDKKAKFFTLKVKRELSALIGAVDFRCIRCKKDIFDEEEIFCDRCREKVSYNDGVCCPVCGSPLNNSGVVVVCSKCNGVKRNFERAYSPFILDGFISTCIYSLKFGGRKSYARAFAKAMSRTARDNGIKFDLVSFVPCSKAELKQRGYNQAQLLAEQFCDIMNANKPLELLIKVKDTARQEKLGYKERLTNLKGVFATADKSIIMGKRILLIDDVLTTGATLDECSRTLVGSGAESIICLTAAVKREDVLLEKATLPQHK